MSYPVFLSILIGGAVLSVAMAALKIFERDRFSECSWLSVPYPLAAAWIAVSHSYVWEGFRYSWLVTFGHEL